MRTAISLLCLFMMLGGGIGYASEMDTWRQEQEQIRRDHDRFWDDHQRWKDRERSAQESRRERSTLPDRITIEKPGKCEVRCTRVHSTGEYKCREYRC
jgi:hypothetical protein